MKKAYKEDSEPKPKEVQTPARFCDYVWKKGENFCKLYSPRDYNEQADLQTIIEKICYEGYKKEDLHDLVYPAFRKLKVESTYLQVLLNESRTFAKVE